MKRVFVCSPYAGNIEENTDKAIEHCLEEIRDGNAPYAPHLFFPQMLDENDPNGREAGIRMGICFLRTCDELHVYGDQATEGMMREIRAARDIGIKIIFMDMKLEEINEKIHG